MPYPLKERLWILDHLEESAVKSWREFQEAFPRNTRTFSAYRERVRSLRWQFGIKSPERKEAEATGAAQRDERETEIERFQKRLEEKRKKRLEETRRRNHENETRRIA